MTDKDRLEALIEMCRDNHRDVEASATELLLKLQNDADLHALVFANYEMREAKRLIYESASQVRTAVRKSPAARKARKEAAALQRSASQSDSRLRALALSTARAYADFRIHGNLVLEHATKEELDDAARDHEQRGTTMLETASMLKTVSAFMLPGQIVREFIAAESARPAPALTP